MKRPAWKTVNAEIAKKHREDERIKQKHDREIEWHEYNIRREYPELIKLAGSCEINVYELYKLPFKKRYAFVKRKIAELLAKELVEQDLIELDAEMKDGWWGLTEHWYGYIQIVDRRKNDN